MNKKQAEKSNRKTAYIMLSFGLAAALITLALALDLGGISTIAPLLWKAVYGFAGCAIALIACGIFAFVHKPTPVELIEQVDERNVAIRNLAAARAFVVLSALVPFCALLLYVFGQLSIAALFVMIGVDVLAFVIYLAHLARYQKSR